MEAVIFLDPRDNHEYAGERLDTGEITRNGVVVPGAIFKRSRGTSVLGKMAGTTYRTTVARPAARLGTLAAAGTDLALGATAAAVGATAEAAVSAANAIEAKTGIGRKTKKVINEISKTASDLDNATGFSKFAKGSGKALASGAKLTGNAGLDAYGYINNLTNQKRGSYRQQGEVTQGLSGCQPVGMFYGGRRTRKPTRQLNRKTRHGKRCGGTQSRRQRLQSTRTTRLI